MHMLCERLDNHVILLVAFGFKLCLSVGRPTESILVEFFTKVTPCFASVAVAEQFASIDNRIIDGVVDHEVAFEDEEKSSHHIIIGVLRPRLGIASLLSDTDRAHDCAHPVALILVGDVHLIDD